MRRGEIRVVNLNPVVRAVSYERIGKLIGIVPFDLMIRLENALKLH